MRHTDTKAGDDGCWVHMWETTCAGQAGKAELHEKPSAGLEPPRVVASVMIPSRSYEFKLAMDGSRSICYQWYDTGLGDGGPETFTMVRVPDKNGKASSRHSERPAIDWGA